MANRAGTVKVIRKTTEERDNKSARSKTHQEIEEVWQGAIMRYGDDAPAWRSAVPQALLALDAALGTVAWRASLGTS